MRGSAAAAVLALLLAGCAGSTHAPEGAFECVPQIRLEGVIYTGYGYTDREATKQWGKADEAACDDAGSDAAGSVFLDNPKQVEVWTFADYAADEVLGVRFGEGSFSVFIAESVPRKQGDRILSELSAK